MKKGQFIGQFEKTISSEEINKVVDLVKYSLDVYHVAIEKITFEKAYDGMIMYFHVAGLDYENRDRRKNTVSGIKTIKCYFISQYGYMDYDYLRQLEAEGKKTVETATDSSYNFTFCTDGKIREYRCKKWYTLEGKNHYMYNDDLEDSVLREEMHSYFVNLLAYKGL